LRLTRVNFSAIQFGIGPRVCIGRNISLMELWKVLPELVRAFEFRLVDPSKPWRIYGLWFTKQVDMDMYVLPRAAAPAAAPAQIPAQVE